MSKHSLQELSHYTLSAHARGESIISVFTGIPNTGKPKKADKLGKQSAELEFMPMYATIDALMEPHIVSPDLDWAMTALLAALDSITFETVMTDFIPLAGNMGMIDLAAGELLNLTLYQTELRHDMKRAEANRETGLYWALAHQLESVTAEIEYKRHGHRVRARIMEGTVSLDSETN